LDVLEGKIENRGVHSTAYEIIKQWVRRETAHTEICT
jgi:hypothetical protein